MSDSPTARTLPSRCGAPDVPLAPGERIGEWTIRGTLGAGGMATVYEVVNDAGRRAAVKLAHRALIGPDLPAETFLREARVAEQIGHAGAIAVHATGMHDGRPYLVLELLRGTSLGARLDAGAPLPRVVACELLLELVDVLRAAHASGVTHRDLKPDNVFLLAPRGERRLKLLDWGVAHVAGEPDPYRTMIAGTLSYVAPEQIRGDESTTASDVYALGVLAFRMFCTRAPFAAQSDLDLLKLHLHAPPPRARTAWPAIPDTLDDLLAAMLAKEPLDRPSLDEVERVLQASWVELAPRRIARGTEPQVTYRRSQQVATPEPPPNAHEPAESHAPRWLPVALGLARIFTMLW
jgi:serine/threonine-protein kinase